MHLHGCLDSEKVSAYLGPQMVLYPVLFKRSFNPSTEGQHQSALTFGIDTNSIKQDAIILTWVVVVADEIVKRTKEK